MRKLSIFILYSIFLVSCESLVEDFKIRKPDDKITLNGYALADSIPYFYLTSNLSLEDPVEFPPITGARVELLMNDDIVDTLYIDEEGWYTDGGYSFTQGNSYSLRVSASGYNSVNADFYVPTAPQMSILDTNLITETYPDCPDCGEIYYLEFEIQFLNESGIDDFYSVEVAEQSYCVENEYYDCEEYTVNYWNRISLNSNAPYIEAMLAYEDQYTVRNAAEDAWGPVFYFSDRLLDEGNNRLTFTCELNLYGFDPDNSYSLLLMFKKIDKPMFEYVRSKGRNSDAEDNPFVQPVSIYSNVNNGLGLVSGSSQTSILVDLSDIISNLPIDDYYYGYR